MNMLLTDTDPAVEKIQVELLRRAGSGRRFALVRSLSRTAMHLSRRAIRRANSGASEQENLLSFLSLHYGEKIAEAVRRHLAGRNN
jgi:hypothetical protein